MDNQTEQKTTHVQHQETVVSSSNADQIFYQDGKIQQKVYGGQGGQGSNFKQVLVHFIQNTKQTVDTHIVKLEPKITVQQLCTLLEQRTKTALNNINVKSKLQDQPLSPQSQLQTILKDHSQAKPQLYFFYDQTKAIIKQKTKQAQYHSLTKYSFIDDKTKVKVYIELQGIGAVPADKIISRFLQWSIEIRIHDYKGKNWIFAVPKTQCLLKPKQSKVIQKDNKLIVSIAKNAEADNWFSLYKVKCVGQRDE